MNRILTRIKGLIKQHPVRVLWLIAILGLLCSIIAIIDSPPTMASGSTDSWWVISENLVHGRGYSLCIPRYFPFCSPTNQTTAAREPVPVFLFALVALLSGDSLWAATAVELIIFLAVLVLIYYLTREWANSSAGLLAALLWSFYPVALDHIPQVSGDLLAALCLTIGMLFFMRARRTNATRDWVIAGSGIGLAVMSRSVVLAIAAALIGGQVLDDLWHNRKSIRQIGKPFVILSACLILVMVPWLVRNKIEFGQVVIGSSLTGYNMLRQSHLFENDDNFNYFRYVGGIEGVEAVNDFLELKRGSLTGTENEAQLNTFYREEALKVIMAHPVKFVLLTGYHFLPLWFNWQILEADGHKTPLRDYAIMVLQAILLVLAVYAAWKNLYYSWPLWLGVAAICFAYMSIEGQLRYLLPVMPIVLSLSSVGWHTFYINSLQREKTKAVKPE